MSDYHRKRYQENPEYYSARNKRIYDGNKQWIDDIKSTLKCTKCGEDRNWLLDFHHVDPSKKDFNIGDLYKFKTEKAREKVLNEIGKCITLCKNCHSDFHYLEKRDGITTEIYIGAQANLVKAQV